MRFSLAFTMQTPIEHY